MRCPRAKLDFSPIVCVFYNSEVVNTMNQDIYHIELSLKKNVVGDNQQKWCEVNAISDFKNHIDFKDVLDSMCIKD